jgi:putative chitinase
MAIDRAKLFAGIRGNPMPGTLTQDAVRGINAILDEWERRGLTDLRWLAYMLATVLAECGHNMLPVREGFKLTDEAARAYVARKGYKYAVTVNGHVYYGRGLVQLTWQANYVKMGALLGVDLAGNPDLALDPTIAAKIMFEGMIRGSFTGKKLADYLNSGTNWNARPIINGHDREAEIAGYAKQFYADLLHAEVAPHTLPATLPPAPTIAGPVGGGMQNASVKPLLPVTPIALPAPASPPVQTNKHDGIAAVVLTAIVAAAAAAYNWAMEHLPEIFLAVVAALVLATIIFRWRKGHWPWTSLHFPGVQLPALSPPPLPSWAAFSAPALEAHLAALRDLSPAKPSPQPLAFPPRLKRSARLSPKTRTRPSASRSSKKSTPTRSSSKRKSRSRG